MRGIPAIATLLGLTAVGCGTLDSASGQVSPPIASPEALETRRVWTGLQPDGGYAAPSPDGRYITGVDWSTPHWGNLSVIELETGVEHRITDKFSGMRSEAAFALVAERPELFSEFDAEAGSSVFSPDGDRLAYVWFPAVQREDGTHFHAVEVRTIHFDGSDMRTLMTLNPDMGYVQVEEWSPDAGSILLTASRRDGTSQIGILSVGDGTYQALKTNGWHSGASAAFSADGSYVAYDLSGETEPGRDIFLLATDGSREVPLVTGPGDDQLLGWLPDGSGILYHSETPGSGEIRALRIDAGEATGEPQLIRSDVGQITPFGFSRNAFFYQILVEKPQVHVISIDLGAGRVLSDPVLLGDPRHRRSSAVWSPDGQRVAYVGEGGALVIRSVTGELQRRMQIDIGGANAHRWTSDGGGLLLTGTDSEGRGGVYRIDLRSGESELVPEVATFCCQVMSPDGQTLYGLEGVAVDGGRRYHTKIIARDLGTGEDREIAEIEVSLDDVYVLSPSPDGGQLALSTENGHTILIVSVSSGTVRELYHTEGAPPVLRRRTIPWTPDGSAVLWFVREVGEAGGLWRIPVNGGTPDLLIPVGQLETTGGLSAGEFSTVGAVRLSPDGRRLLYTSGQVRGEYWMMSGFDVGDPGSTGSENR